MAAVAVIAPRPALVFSASLRQAREQCLAVALVPRAADATVVVVVAERPQREQADHSSAREMESPPPHPIRLLHPFMSERRFLPASD